LRILIVDSDPAFRRDASVAFDESQVEHVCVEGWVPAHEELTRRGNGKFDAMVVEIGRPSSKGHDFLRMIRASGIQVPLIFSSRRESSEDRVKGLELGADDYIVKPLEWRDLLARLRAVIRRQLRAPKIGIGVFEVDLAQRRVEIAGKTIHFSTREFDLFWVLLEAGGRAVSHAELRKRLWSDGPDRSSNVVAVHVSHLRRKLARTVGANIESVRGEGYRLNF
jgi:two-component system OmpR family response regulator/two-component system response regulator QseB